MNIDGFVGETVELCLCDALSKEVAAGTVDAKTFLNQFQRILVKVLWIDRDMDRNRIVIMGNASTYMSDKVRLAIEFVGAYNLMIYHLRD